ncbi:DUF2269 family protein [Baekduia soli]|uniref:DUF2269 family protein n=1 Tax=Baekduia soli TaxID=496014 RepID=UPI001652A334|nr:DUF2269 family protein [Baekduia soli]
MVTTYTVALFCHVLGVLLFASGIVLAGAPFEIARRRSSPAEITAILGIARAGAMLASLGMILVLGFGLWLVHLSGFGFSTGWVQAALALFVVALALGGYGGQRPKRARLHAADLAATGRPLDAKLRQLLDDRVSRAANYTSALIVLGILALMIFKP